MKPGLPVFRSTCPGNVTPRHAVTGVPDGNVMPPNLVRKRAARASVRMQSAKANNVGLSKSRIMMKGPELGAARPSLSNHILRVLSCCSEEQVVKPDATPVVARVTDKETICDWSPMESPRGSMRLLLLSEQPKLAVSPRVDGAHEVEAAGLVLAAKAGKSVYRRGPNSHSLHLIMVHQHG